MNQVRIRLRPNYKLKSYIFGYSQTNDISTVHNWQIANNVFTIANDGLYYLFAKHINTNIFSVFQKYVGCGGTPLLCTIEFLPAYCLVVGTTDTFETDWTSGEAIGADCVISWLNPYLV